MDSNSSHDGHGHPLKWLLLILVSIGTFMCTLDVSIVNVALPTLRTVFHTSVGVTQWVVLAYTFVITILLLTFGKVGDLIGRRRLYTIGILIFVLGSLACGLSMSILMLILARGVQGVGSAITMSCGPALVTEAFGFRQRGKGLGLIGTAVALGLLAGPVAGGFLVEYASWRWMFFINIPIGLALTALFAARIRGFDECRDGSLDLPGAALMSAALALLLVGLTYGETLGWTSPATAAILGFALVFGAAFVWLEKRTDCPLLDLRLFQNREFSIGAIAGWANYAATIPLSVFIPFYLQETLRLQPNKVGLILGFGPLTLAFVAPITGSLSDRIGSRLLTSVGLVLAGLGVLSMCALTANSSWLDVVWRLVLASFGSAVFVSPNSSSIMGSVKSEDLGAAAGILALVRNLGMVCGVALAGAIIATTQSRFYVTPEVARAPALQSAGFLAGLKAAMLVAAAISFFGALISALRVRPGDREAFERMTTS